MLFKYVLILRISILFGGCMKYAHGEFIITRCGDAVVTQAYGPWNKECVEHFVTEYRTIVEELFGKVWCSIVCVAGESLLIPDAEILLRARIEAMHPLGLTHIAVVLRDSTAKATTKAQLKRVYSGLNIEFTFVEAIEEAVSWAEQGGFTINSKNISSHLEKVASK